MADTHLHVGDIGIELRANTYYNLTNAESVALILLLPSGTITEVAGDIVDVNKGTINYITKEDDLAYEGEYTVQALVYFKNGSRITGASHTFRVHNLFT